MLAELLDVCSPAPADSVRHQVLLRCRALLPEVQPAHELCHDGTSDGAEDARFPGIHRSLSRPRMSDGHLFRFVLVWQRRGRKLVSLRSKYAGPSARKLTSTHRLDPHKCSSFSNPHLQKVTWTMNIVGELLRKLNYRIDRLATGFQQRQELRALVSDSVPQCLSFPFPS